MAFMIPEAVPTSSPEGEQMLFALLRRHLPSDCAVWHHSALELEPEEQVPFLIISREIGLATLSPLDWQPSEISTVVAGFWQQQAPDGPLSKEQADILMESEARFNGFRQLLLDSGLPELINGKDLRPALQRVYVLTNFNGKDVTSLRLRGMARGALVLGQDEVIQLYDILQRGAYQQDQLTDRAFNAVRLIVSPGIEIRLGKRRRTEVDEGPLALPSSGNGRQGHPLTLDLQQEQVIKSFAYIPPEHQSTAKDLDTRLIRGVVGSGKSLILLHRAKFLSQLYPHWRILLLTFNRSLADFLSGRLEDLPGQRGNIEIASFHAWCRRYLIDVRWPADFLKDWQRQERVEQLMPGVPSPIASLDPSYVVDEIDWIRDQLLGSWEKYATADRRGRGKPLAEAARQEIFDLHRKYRRSLYQQNIWDWTEVPLAMSWAIGEGKISGRVYDAVLVDEAQDFAPSWFAVVQHMLKPETNMLFMVADAAQKIYRRTLSWRSLGIDVTGNRSRVLKRSYRNTFEILQVAYEVIGKEDSMRDALRSEGDDLIQPELNTGGMRHGPMPIILSFNDVFREYAYVAKEIKRLVAAGSSWNEIAIIHRDLRTLRELSEHLVSLGIPTQVVKGLDINLASPDVKLVTLHSSKGLEFAAVFIVGVERLAPQPGLTAEELQAALDEERRLLYVGMTRARDYLFISHSGPLPHWVDAALTLAERPRKQS